MIWRRSGDNMKGRKILFVGSSLIGAGVARVMLNLAEEWNRQGAKMLVATLMRDEGNTYPVPKDVRRIALDVAGKKTIFSLFCNLFALVFGLRKVLAREEPDIVVAHGTISYLVLALARNQNVIAVGFEHIYPPAAQKSEAIKGALRNLALRFLFGRLDAVVVLARKSANWVRVHTRARHVTVIPNSIVLPMASGMPCLKVRDVVTEGRRVLLAVGQLAHYKGFDRLLEAFALVAPRHGDWDLVILGEGKLRDTLEAHVARLGLGERVFLPGFAGNMTEWYRTVDAFVMTSRWEGFPLVLLEAMAYGCPVISVDCDTGPRDIIRNGEDGLLVAQNDPAALVTGLDQMLEDGALRKRLASRAVEVVERFSPERIREMWQELFDELEAKQE